MQQGRILTIVSMMYKLLKKGVRGLAAAAQQQIGKDDDADDDFDDDPSSPLLFSHHHVPTTVEYSVWNLYFLYFCPIIKFTIYTNMIGGVAFKTI